MTVEFNVGDIVHIRPGSRFYGRGACNPDSSVYGRVCRVSRQAECLPIGVSWGESSRNTNSYDASDLVLVARPKRKIGFAKWIREKDND
jgi:hypothetical protein